MLHNYAKFIKLCSDVNKMLQQHTIIYVIPITNHIISHNSLFDSLFMECFRVVIPSHFDGYHFVLDISRRPITTI